VPPPRRLLDQLRDALRTRHYSLRTEEAYVRWARRFILFHGKRHPKEMGAPEVVAFLAWLATERRVAAPTQNQALSPILFLYRVVLRRELEGLDRAVRAHAPPRLPVVLSKEEVRAVLRELALANEVYGLMGTLLYGSGLRLMECLRLRVRDVDFARHQLSLRRGKGGADRPAILPRSAEAPLRRQLERVQALHRRDLAAGRGRVKLPHALSIKYPQSDREWEWQWVFPSSHIGLDPRFRTRASSPPPRVGPAARGDAGGAPCGALPARELPRAPATPSRRTCSRAARTSARCRSCSATAT
jgi:integron integrase